jgi:hypothetical protein
VNPAPLLADAKEHLAEGLPKAQGAIADREHGAAHAPAGAARSKSARDSPDSWQQSLSATSSLEPSARAPSIRWASSRTILSNAEPSGGLSSSLTTLSTVVPSRPVLQTLDDQSITWVANPPAPTVAASPGCGPPRFG